MELAPVRKEDIIVHARDYWEVNLNGKVPSRALYNPHAFHYYMCDEAIDASSFPTNELTILQLIAIYIWSKLPYSLKCGVFIGHSHFHLIDSMNPQPGVPPSTLEASGHKGSSTSETDD